jgi:uncharacterized membrane protein YqjE
VSEAPAAAGDARGEAEAGASSRLVRAAEMLASTHAARARDEASRDLARLGSGVLLLGLAVALAALALLMLDVAAVLFLDARLGLGLGPSAALVAAFDAVLAVMVGLVARARLSAPVMRETRNTIKRAVAVIRGT